MLTKLPLLEKEGVYKKIIEATVPPANARDGMLTKSPLVEKECIYKNHFCTR
jgi:hypothetical protein